MTTRYAPATTIDRTGHANALRVTLSTGAVTGTVPSGRSASRDAEGAGTLPTPDAFSRYARATASSDMTGRLVTAMPESTSRAPSRTTGTPTSHREVAPLPYKKRAIPQAVRREVCIRAGAVFGQNAPIKCAYCPHVGMVVWRQRTYGWPSIGGDLELDHVIPERHGGPSTADNIVLACRRCNRRKGSKV